MSWKNARYDGLPDDNQRVLISVDGIYYMASYIADQSMFYVAEGPGYHFYVGEENIYWTYPDSLI